MFILLAGNEAIVFDPHENDELLTLFRSKDINNIHILLTHGHYDHISGVMWLKEQYQADVFCQQKCAERLVNKKRPLVRLVAMVLSDEDKIDGGHRYRDFMAGYKPFTITPDKTFGKIDHFCVGEYDIHVTSTPGHSEGSACYEVNGCLLFTGDTLLKDYPVITRFPGGNKDDYKKIALPYLQSLDKNLIVMPGHGDPFVLSETKNL
jgi:glyoxylase-like metal-dependent hydrolase (beta-lactamase superfamily II)